MAARYHRESTASADSTSLLFHQLDSRKRKVEQACKHELTKLFEEAKEQENLVNLNERAAKIIQDTPVNIARKRELKGKYITRRSRRGSLVQPTERKNKKWKNIKSGLSDFFKVFIVWRSSIKTVGGKFGNALVSYFVFLRWLFFLNLFITFVLASFVVVPEIFINQESVRSLYNISDDDCAGEYLESIDDSCKNGSAFVCVENLLFGKGWVEETILFYGSYSPAFAEVDATISERLPGLVLGYNRPLAYMVTTVIYLALCFIVMIKYATSLLKKNLVFQKKTDPQKYSTLLFSGWDHNVDKRKTAVYRRQNIFFHLQVELEEDLGEIIRQKRHFIHKISRNGVRALVHLIVTLCNICSYFLIFQATQFALRRDFEGIVQDLVDLLPSVTLVILNNVLNNIFTKIIQYEDYTPSFEVFMNLVRIGFLKLASLLVVLSALYTNISCDDGSESPCGACIISEDHVVSCWETEVGQQFYELTIVDLLFTIFTVLFWEYPRKFLSRKFKWARPLGNIEFELTTQVLNLVNSQAISWLGSFFCPLLPLITTVKFFILFYLRKWSLLHNMRPSSRESKAARSGFFFVILLAVTFLLCLIPIAYAIVNFPPSEGCGPFRGLQSSWLEIDATFRRSEFPGWLLAIYGIIGTAPAVIAALSLLILAMYYQYSESSISSERIDTLEQLLKLEKRAKQSIKKKIRELRRMKTEMRREVGRTL